MVPRVIHTVGVAGGQAVPGGVGGRGEKYAQHIPVGCLATALAGVEGEVLQHWNRKRGWG